MEAVYLSHANDCRSVQTFQNFFNSALSSLRHPASLIPSTSLNSAVSSIDRKVVASAGVILAEVVGFFTVGEMIGRFKVVGYRSSASHEH
jgi:F-type H+-transporting ATPase subunit g